jgi:predicted DNA-binding protein (MmcQ/YjbR family)
MNRDDVLDSCASMPGAVEDYPFGDEVAVFKVGGRMFALVSLDGSPGSVSLKCDPTLALELRALHSSIRPGYHLNKRHWNTVEIDGSVDDGTMREMMQRSYELVVSHLPRAERDRLAGTKSPRA